jgi:hypothetical protein
MRESEIEQVFEWGEGENHGLGYSFFFNPALVHASLCLKRIAIDLRCCGAIVMRHHI